jgi:hypothetical protein
VALALAAAVIAAVVWGASYQPLGRGSTGLDPIPSRQGPLGETVAEFRN